MRRLYSPILVSTILSFVAIILYISTTPAGLTWDLGGADGGEYATAVYTQGLVHSPGSPTYLILAQIVHLWPHPSFAYRLNLFSALAMGGAVFMLAQTLQKSSAENKANIWFSVSLGTTLFAVMPQIWSQAIITEVYALAALFCMIIFHLGYLLHEDPKLTSRLSGLAFTAGLAIGSHYLTLFPLLFVVLWLSLTAKTRAKIWQKEALITIPFFLLGLATFLYLPIRAGQVPLSNWGDPTDWQNFWAVVSGEIYADRFQLANMALFLGGIGRVVTDQIGFAGGLLAIWGLTQWWEQKRPLFIAAVITISLNILWVAGYNSADTLPYLYPTLILLIWPIAQTLADIVAYAQNNLGNRFGRILFLWIISIVVIAPPLATNSAPIFSASTAADDYGQHLATHLPPNAILITYETKETFSIKTLVRKRKE